MVSILIFAKTSGRVLETDKSQSGQDSKRLSKALVQDALTRLRRTGVDLEA